MVGLILLTHICNNGVKLGVWRSIKSLFLFAGHFCSYERPISSFLRFHAISLGMDVVYTV
jgi:hypothetical protein